jgi:hypothetical protein
MSAIDRAITVAAGATVVVLTSVAGAISYSHMAELGRLHGETGWRAHAFPISVDGIEIVASLVLLAHRRASTRAGSRDSRAVVDRGCGEDGGRVGAEEGVADLRGNEHPWPGHTACGELGPVAS